jgi:hypothetical protein
MSNKVTMLIGKYTLLLAMTYAVEFGVDLLMQMADVELYSLISIWARLLPAILTIVLNVIMAIILYPEIARMKISAPYVILATVLFRPVGVCAFLIYMIIRDKNESIQEPIDGILDR